ncbi:MAG: double zinc ribbon domain-containing protein [Bacteroidales bacterium]
MKFCPQCGTTFENNARFCLECGFDKSTVGPIEEPVINTAPPITLNKSCPKCGTFLVPEDRFCLECGFDTSSLQSSENLSQKTFDPIVVEAFPPNNPRPEPELPFANRKPCPKCGSDLEEKERFCAQCGFDTSPGKTSFEPVEQPSVKPQAVYSNPIEQQQPPTIKKPENSRPPIQPASIPPHAKVDPPKTSNSVSKPKSIKTGLWILLIVIGLGILGVIAWNRYNTSDSQSKESIADSISNTLIPETPVADITDENTAMPDQTAGEVAEQPAKPTKTLSRIDQELAKEKARIQNSSTKQTTPQAQQNKTDLGVKVSPSPNAVNDNPITVLHEVGQSDEPKNKGPKKPTKFTLSEPTMIVMITTDHYNGGMGTPAGGSIIIKDKNENIVGTYKARGKSGKNGTPNAKWVAEPRKRLEKGTYYISDTDMTTWSKNIIGIGFVVVEGYEVE